MYCVADIMLSASFIWIINTCIYIYGVSLKYHSHPERLLLNFFSAASFLLFIYLSIYLYFVCMRFCLPDCYMYHMCTQCLQRSEESIRSPRTVVNRQLCAT